MENCRLEEEPVVQAEEMDIVGKKEEGIHKNCLEQQKEELDKCVVDMEMQAVREHRKDTEMELKHERAALGGKKAMGKEEDRRKMGTRERSQERAAVLDVAGQMG